MGHNCSVFHKEGTNKQTLEEQRIVTVVGKGLEPGGVASEELVDRCRTGSRVMGEVKGTLVIPIGQCCHKWYYSTEYWNIFGFRKCGEY